MRDAGGPGQGRGDEPVPGADVLLLLEGLQDEVRREPRPVRQVTPVSGAGHVAGPEDSFMPVVHPIVDPEVTDPVCGMSILPADAVGHVTHRGQTYHFCSQSCLDRFQAAPEVYLTPFGGLSGGYAVSATRTLGLDWLRAHGCLRRRTVRRIRDAAAINAAVYHVMTERRVAAITAGSLPVAARAAGLISLSVWTVVILAGRMMSYTMF